MKLPVTLALLVLVALVISGIHPYDRATWLMEVAPIFIAAPVLVATYRRLLADPSTRRELGSRARERLLQEHTYTHRAQQLLNILGWRAPSVSPPVEPAFP